MTTERTAELEGARSDAAITAFVAEHYDRLLRLANMIGANGSRSWSGHGDASWEAVFP